MNGPARNASPPPPPVSETEALKAQLPPGPAAPSARLDARFRLATLNLMEDAAEERRRTEREAAERHRAEESLRRSEERLKAALSTARMASWDWDPKSDRMSASDNAAEVFGLRPGETLHSREVRLGLLHPEDLERHRALVQRAVEQGAAWNDEYRIVRPRDGRIAWLEERAMVSRDPGTNQAHMTGLVWDISERKATEAALQAALAQAERARLEAESAIQIKDRFLAILSHELRTPLTPVLFSAEMLLQGEDLLPQTRASLERICRNVEIESRLIDDLLDLTRIGAGKFEIRQEMADVHDALMAAVHICDPEIQAKAQRLTLGLNAARSKTVGDSLRLQQVFWNLLKNASKFTPEHGQIAISSEDRPGSILLRICDNGAGIPPEALPHIFEPFRQGGNAASRHSGGLGLGLAIARAVIDAHGGAIEASSGGTGCGAVFQVVIPVPA